MEKITIKKLLVILLCLPIIGLGQIHSIDQYNLYMSGNTNHNDISVNTYYNALDTCNISWNIIQDSLPSQWDFSICFPDCHAIGITSYQDVFFPNEQAYLNCHMYPNGQVGEGIIQMEITTNNLYKDTITWTGSVNSISFVDEFNLLNLKNQELIKIVDLSGRETKKLNKPLFYIYNNGKVDKRIVIY